MSSCSRAYQRAVTLCPPLHITSRAAVRFWWRKGRQRPPLLPWEMATEPPCAWSVQRHPCWCRQEGPRGERLRAPPRLLACTEQPQAHKVSMELQPLRRPQASTPPSTEPHLEVSIYVNVVLNCKLKTMKTLPCGIIQMLLARDALYNPAGGEIDVFPITLQWNIDIKMQFSSILPGQL